MLLQANKKGVSIVIGYVLLVTFAIIISAMVYAWMKTYVPTGKLECPDGTSLMIKSVNCSYNGTNYVLSLTLKNNGRFNLAGYYIHATNDSSQETATINLVDNLDNEGVGGIKFGSSILFYTGNQNQLNINQEKTSLFVIDDPIYSISIIPTRFEEVEGKTKFIGCGSERVREDLDCS